MSIENRKYTCFVCGINLNTHEEYKNHIVEKHELGRDYVLCPLQRCGYPVRCIKTHYKLHHPREKVPETRQLKATIWRDFSKNKKINKKPNFKEGYFLSRKNNNKSLHYRSGYELEVYKALEEIDEVLEYYVEPIKIGYLFEGKKHTYNPDLVVIFYDNHKEIWEIKPSNQTDLPKNNAKWVACDNYCQTRGWKFVVITERGIGKLKKISRKIK
jgi:hypothetical protein